LGQESALGVAAGAKTEEPCNHRRSPLSPRLACILWADWFESTLTTNRRAHWKKLQERHKHKYGFCSNC
jgi:hypothetical protein